MLFESKIMGKSHPNPHRLAGLVVKASALGEEDPGFESRLRQDFSGLSHTSDFKIGTAVATLPGTWHYRVSTGTGQPVSKVVYHPHVVFSNLNISFCDF